MVNQYKYSNNIVIPFEIKKREIDLVIFLASFLSTKNYKVYIGSKQRIYSNLEKFPKSIFILKSIGPKNYGFLKKIKSLGHKICCLDIEGISYLKNDILKTRASNENLGLIDYFFCWGKQNYIDIKSVFPKYTKKFVITGHPKIEILKKQNSVIFRKESKIIKKQIGKFILITTFFNNYNFFDKTKNEKEIRKFIWGNNTIAKPLQIHQKKNLFHTLKMIDKIRENFPKRKIIIRPHPAENQNFWKKKYKDIENVRVIVDNQSTCSWILASEINIACNCSTLFESFFLNKLSLNFMPYTNKKVHYTLPNATGYYVKNVNTLIDILKNKNFKNLKLNKSQLKIIPKIIHNFNNENSNKEILKYLNRIQLTSKVVEYPKVIFFIKKILRIIARYKMLMSFNKTQILIDHKIGRISKKEIINKVNDFRHKNVKIGEFLPDIFTLN